MGSLKWIFQILARDFKIPSKGVLSKGLQALLPTYPTLNGPVHCWYAPLALVAVAFLTQEILFTFPDRHCFKQKIKTNRKLNAFCNEHSYTHHLGSRITWLYLLNHTF